MRPLPLALSLAVVALAALTSCGSNAAKSDVTITKTADGVTLRWPIPDGKFGSLVLSSAADAPLISSLGVANTASGDATPILTNVDPTILLTVGSRSIQPRQQWFIFFDNPREHPHNTYAVKLTKTEPKITREGERVTVTVADAVAGPFSGTFQFTVYPGSPLVRTEAVMSTTEPNRAIDYDAGLTSAKPNWDSMAWIDNHDQFHEQPVDLNAKGGPVEVRYRTMVAQAKQGSVAIFPAPHQYFYPLDFAVNFGFAWFGANYSVLTPSFGFGIRHSLEGDKRWVPWFNAPPNTQQHLSFFCLVSPDDAKAAISQVGKYTHGDKYVALPGFKTFTSHYHIEHTLEFLRKQKEQNTTGVPKGLEVPTFTKTFLDRGVNIVHLAEFHVGETPNLQTDVRLAQLRTLHEECERLSNDDFLVLPGEEPNVHLGGHWISFFPKPIYWVLNRPAGTPFSEDVPGFGTVYHVGSSDDVLQLMEKENGLMWTAHARTKASVGFPDDYKDSPFFKSPHFLGAAWKALPADLSRDTLGWRVLDLLSDMDNWGDKKFSPGEVDIFRVEPEFETYAHMNINYLELDKLPHFKDGWASILDTLREGRFFVTTGEVLIPKFTLDGKRSGETLELKGRAGIDFEAEVSWTFPLNFAEIVSGDGKQVYRERISLTDTREFGKRTLSGKIKLEGRTWARLEVWDIAANGAFTQPLWITP